MTLTHVKYAFKRVRKIDKHFSEDGQKTDRRQIGTLGVRIRKETQGIPVTQIEIQTDKQTKYLQSVICTICFLLFIVYCVLCTWYFVVCTVYCVLCSVFCVLCSVFCVLFIVYCVLCSVFCVCVLCSVLCVLCTVNCALCTVYSTSVHCICVAFYK